MTLAHDDAQPVAKAGRHGPWLLAVLSALMAFGGISTDLYLPAMPTMAASLGSDAGTMELTVSGYLVGFSLGQLVWGPLGDRYGRRTPVALGLVLFVVGSAGCALSTDAWHLVGWRVVQAVGACAGVVLARAMVRDLYSGDRATQMLSTLMTVMAVAPLVGALQYGTGIVGSALVGALADGTPWPMGWVIAAFSLGAVACAWFLVPENKQEERARYVEPRQPRP